MSIPALDKIDRKTTEEVLTNLNDFVGCTPNHKSENIYISTYIFVTNGGD